MTGCRGLCAAGLALLVLASATPVRGGEPRLSADDRPPNIDSTYGSGSFGTWYVDRFGLPAFRYDVDEQTDPRARQPELFGATRAQHQLGNDHIVAAAFNHGYMQLWSQARLSQWANRYEPESRHWAGGYGYLLVDGTIASSLTLDRADATSLARHFGVGYFRKAFTTSDVDVEQVVYAPFGDDPVLLDDVTLTNRAEAPKTVSWFEYWDVNPYDQTGMVHRGLGQPVWDAETRTLSVAQFGGHLDDPAPLALFASGLQGPLDGFETSVAAFFGAGTRAAPASVAADRLSGTLVQPTSPGAAGDTLFAFRAPVVLAPGETVTLRYAYGMAHADQIPALVAKYGATRAPLGDSEAAWARWLPKADFGRRWRWVARELMWDAYLLRSASVYEELCGHHTITQGGYYQYVTGLNLGFRSWPHYLLPITYMEPELAREILRYTIALQPAAGNQFAYGTGPMCTLAALGTSGDLDFWLLLAAAEYGLGSRDRAFFDEPIPFYDTKEPATAWEHVKLAYRHQETLRLSHGGYAAGTNGDWSDFSTAFLQMTESTLVGLQVAYAYPRLAELADRLGDHAFAVELRARARELRRVLRGEWTGRGWYSRGYSGERQIGAGAIFGEPQPWGLLARIPTAGQARRLVANIRRFLGGVGAPAILGGPARLGSAQSPAHNDPDVTERSPVPVGIADNNANYVGGVWYDINGWLTWALGELDGVVPHARRFAWSEYIRNTLATHAAEFPDHWAGTISVDDTCHSHYSVDPERCGNGIYRDYDGQITEQPTWMVMNAIRLAGLTPTERGYRIAPHLPFTRFSLRLPQIGIAGNGRGLRGYVRVQETEPVELRVRVPPGAAIEARANGRVVPHRIAGRFVVFRLRAAAGEAADWAVRWTAGG